MLHFSVSLFRVCTQNISTPIITAKLVQDDSKTSARVVKAKIEKTTLGQVVIELLSAVVFSPCFGFREHSSCLTKLVGGAVVRPLNGHISFIDRMVNIRLSYIPE